MKTTFKFIIAAMAAIAVFSSCQKELVNESANKTTDGVRTISVQFDNSTKATLDNFTPKFVNGDEIRVSNASESQKCTVSVDASGNATFTTTLTGALTAIYPEKAAVFTTGTPDGAIQSPYFKVPSYQTGKVEDAIIAKATIVSNSATFTGVTALFEITPPAGATSITITSLDKIDAATGRRSATANAATINTTGAGDAAKRKITVSVVDGKAYVALVPGVNLTDLSFDAGENIGLKGIPTSKLGSYSDQTAANTKYTIGNTNWHPYVEIQMNSKTYKWATMNIGASSEADYGYYFFWGGTVGYKHDGSKWVKASDNEELSGGFSRNNDPHYDNTNYKYTKYTGTSGDNKPVLELADDAANSNWGGSWRMPTQAEFDAHERENWVSDPGYGIMFGTYSNAIFLPAAGFGNSTDLNEVEYNVHGNYWSSSLYTGDPGDPGDAYYLNFDNGSIGTPSYTRCNGRSVRALSE